MVRAGYKQTEVGVIPEDWEVQSLLNLAHFGSGTTPSRLLLDRFYKKGIYFWVKTTDLNNNYINSTEEKISQLALNETCLVLHPVGTVLVAMYGGFNQIGRTGLLAIPATVNQALIAIKPNSEKLNSRFLLDYLNFNVEYWKSVASSSRKDPNITSSDIKAFKIAAPSLKEQTAIATALSDIDALITTLTELINKKRQIKTATMQQLLTGKQRLAGFGKGKGMKQTELGEIPEDWEVNNLGNIAPLQRGFDLPSNKIKAGFVPVIYSNGVLNHHNKYMVTGEGVVTGRSGTIGKVHYLTGNYWPHNTTLWVTNFYKNIPKYVFYLYTYIGFEKFLSGSGVPTLNRNDVHSYKISYPINPLEQQAIAQVLSDMDDDLNALETRLAKTKAIKQGMMQELLTGRTRLI